MAALLYPRPAGWETWPVRTVAGSTTASFLETIDGGGGPLRVVLPADRTVPPIRVQNTSNLIIVGGSLRALPVAKIPRADGVLDDQRMLYLPDARGVVHIEGVALDGAVDGAQSDAITINGTTASVRLQNIRATGLRGTESGNHADVFQTILGVRELLVDGLTGTSNYQGIKIALTSTFAIERVELSRIDLAGLTSAQSGGADTSTGGYLWWFDPAGVCPIVLRDFYLTPRGTRSFGQSVWPGVTNSTNPAVVSGGQATWPAAARVTGAVIQGAPPGGQFVPAGAAGLTYTASTTPSPGGSAVPTTITSTREIGAAGYTVNDFVYTATGTMVKLSSIAAGPVSITNGTAANLYRLFDQVDNLSTLASLTVKNVKANGRRGFIKIRAANNILIEDCVGIGQGDAGTTESFPTGFQTENQPVDNIIIRRTRFEQWWSSDRTAAYRNGDAFATEELVTNTLFEDCIGSHNADGGFDLKGQVRLVRCLAENNHRSFRFWGEATATDITSIDPRNAHIWIGGGTRLKGATITRPTFIGGSDKPHIKIDSSSGPATLRIIDPVVPAGETLRISKEAGSQVTVVVSYTGAGTGGVVAARPVGLADAPAPAPPPPASVAPALPAEGTAVSATWSAPVAAATGSGLAGNVPFDGPGAVGFASASLGYASDPVYVWGAPATTAAEALTAESYVDFTVRSAGDWKPQQLRFAIAAGGTVNARGWAVTTSADGHTGVIAQGMTTTVRPTLTPVSVDLTALGTVPGDLSVRLYAYTGSGGRTVDVDDFAVTGVSARTAATTTADLALHLSGASITAPAGTAGFDGWASLVGAGPTFSQADETRRPGVVAAPGGNKALLFDGGDVLGGSSGTNLALARNVTGLTIIAVHRPDVATAAANRAVFYLSRGGSTAYRAGIYQSGAGGAGTTARRLDADEATTANAAAPMTTGAWCVQTGVINYAAGAVATYLDGAQVAAAALPSSGSTSDTDSLNVSVGGRSNGTSDLYSGAIAEILVYRRALSAAERALVEQQLSAKYQASPTASTPLRPFRTGGANIFQLAVNDYPSPRIMGHAEIDSLLGKAVALKAFSVRAHTLGASVGNNAYSLVTGVSGTTTPVIQYNDAAWEAIDYAVAGAAARGIYLTIPLVDWKNHYHGGISQWVNFRYPGRCSTDQAVDATNPAQRAAQGSFCSDAQIVRDFNQYTRDWLLHVNRYTGRANKDEPAIAVLQAGNELWFIAQDFPAWTPAWARLVKSIAPDVLTMDGSSADGQSIVAAHLVEPAINVHGTHPYSTYGAADVTRMARQAAAAGKAFMADEYAWSKTTAPAIEAAARAEPNVFTTAMWSLQNDADLHNGGGPDKYGTDDASFYVPGKTQTERDAVARITAHHAALAATIPAA